MPIVNKANKDMGMGGIRVPDALFERISESVAKTLAQSEGIKRPISAKLGNAVSGDLYVPDTGNARLYISGQGDEPNLLGSIPAVNIPKEFVRSGQPIKVRKNNSGEFEYVGIDTATGAIFNEGTTDEPDQTAITQSQLDFATLQPYSGLTAVVKGAIYGDYAVKDLVTADFSTSPLDTSAAAINIPTTPNRAIGVLVQLDPSTSTLSYKQSAEFNAALSLSAAYSLDLLPLRDAGLWRVGYLRLTTGITQFDYASVWTCAEWFSSDVSLPANSTDNAIALWDGTGGNALKNSTVTIDASGNVGNVNALDFSTATELTISSAAITVTGSYHTVDTEADAATDDLETINGGTTGQLLFLRAANTARTVFLRNNTGSAPKIQNQYGDFALDNTEKAVVMLYDGTNWLALGMLSIPDMYVWGGNVDGTLEFAAWDSSGEVYYKVTGDEIQQLRTAIITADDSYNSQPSLQVEFDSATDRTLTINSGTVAAGHSIFAHALQVSGGTGHKILLPTGVTWDGTNRAILLNAVDDSFIAGAISATRYVIYFNNGCTFAAS